MKVQRKVNKNPFVQRLGLMISKPNRSNRFWWWLWLVFAVGLWLGYLVGVWPSLVISKNNLSLPEAPSTLEAKGQVEVLSEKEIKQSPQHPLTGLLLSDQAGKTSAAVQLPLWAVMIGNSSDARPVSGLEQADVVYEALVESGITRLLAIFSSAQQTFEVGSVRSARPYFIDLAEGYHKPLFLHAGGSPQALKRLKLGGNFVNIEGLVTEGKYFWRNDQREAPHNLYTSPKVIQNLLQSQSIDISELKAWQFDTDLVKVENLKSFDNLAVTYSTNPYNLKFVYLPKLGLYQRQVGSSSASSEEDSLMVSNVIVMKVKTYLVDKLRLGMKLSGQQGEAIVCFNGLCRDSVWKKTKSSTREEFWYQNSSESDDSLTVVNFKPGKSWVVVIPQDRKIEVYQGLNVQN